MICDPFRRFPNVLYENGYQLLTLVPNVTWYHILNYIIWYHILNLISYFVQKMKETGLNTYFISCASFWSNQLFDALCKLHNLFLQYQHLWLFTRLHCAHRVGAVTPTILFGDIGTLEHIYHCPLLEYLRNDYFSGVSSATPIRELLLHRKTTDGIRLMVEQYVKLVVPWRTYFGNSALFLFVTLSLYMWHGVTSSWCILYFILIVSELYIIYTLWCIWDIAIYYTFDI